MALNFLSETSKQRCVLLLFCGALRSPPPRLMGRNVAFGRDYVRTTAEYWKDSRGSIRAARFDDSRSPNYSLLCDRARPMAQGRLNASALIRFLTTVLEPTHSSIRPLSFWRALFYFPLECGGHRQNLFFSRDFGSFLTDAAPISFLFSYADL